jgi:serine/threonine protein kinase
MSTVDFQYGSVLDDKYQIEHLLGKGGMGAVYRATHLGTKRIVALKVINPEFVRNSEFVERFKREAEAAGRLRHPNIVDVTDFGFATVDAFEVAYLVMEYLDGCTLSAVLEEESVLPLKWTADLIEQVCSAIQAAHNLGIIHRDLKPENIWLEPNRRGGYTVKVLDFGLAKLGGSSIELAGVIDGPQMGEAEMPIGSGSESPTLHQRGNANRFEKALTAEEIERDDSDDHLSEPATLILHQEVVDTTEELRETKQDVHNLTRVGSIMGTPYYMSPEQCRGASIDHRSDIYSIGVLAYRMLAGRLPFSGQINSVLSQHIEAAIPPITSKRYRVPRDVKKLVIAALAKEPSQRPQSATAFSNAFGARIQGPGALLRRSLGLYIEQLPIFLRLSIIAHLPLIVCIALSLLGSRVPASWQGSAAIVVLQFIMILAVPLIVLAYSVLSSLTVPIVIQLHVTPLKEIRLRNIFEGLSSRIAPFLGTSLLYAAVVLIGGIAIGYALSYLSLPGIFGFTLSVLPTLFLIVAFVLFGPVVGMERLSGRFALVRAFMLARRAWKTVLFITLIQLSLPILTGAIFHLYSLQVTMNSVSLNFQMSSDWASIINLLSYIFVNPLLAIISAFLYLKARQAGGETLEQAMATLDADRLPRSRWQSRMVTPQSSRSSH